MMTREQELYSTWTMKMMKEEADRLGIKIDTKGRKTKAADKILAAWKLLEEEKPEEAPVPEETKEEKSEEVEEVQEPEPVQEEEKPEELEEAPAPQEPVKKRTRKAPVENMFDRAAVILNTFDVEYVVSPNGKEMKVIQGSEKLFELRRRAARVRLLIGDETLAKINPELYTNDGGPGLSKKLNHSIYVDRDNIMVVINSILA